MVPLYSVLFLFWVIEIYFMGENYSIIKTTSFKNKEKSSWKYCPQREINMKIVQYNYFPYVKEYLKSEKVLFYKHNYLYSL